MKAKAKNGWCRSCGGDITGGSVVYTYEREKFLRDGAFVVRMTTSGPYHERCAPAAKIVDVLSSGERVPSSF